MIKTYKITVNGKSYDVTVEETGMETQNRQPAEITLAQSKPEAAQPKAAQRENAKGAVVAPMPGKVLKLCAAKGDAVKAGQILLILEAMKMENEIFAPADGTVSEIFVSAGNNVSTGDALLVVE